MTIAPTYEAIKRETSRKPSIREKPAEFVGTVHQCKYGSYHQLSINKYESMETFIRIVKWYLKRCILASSMLFCYGICDSINYIISIIIHSF